MKLSIQLLSVISIAALFGGTSGAIGGEPASPPQNPHIAESPWPMAHANPGQSDYNPVAGLTGPSRMLKPSELKWVPLGPVNAWEILYSAPYPDGRRVIWSGGGDRIIKLDAETLEVLSTHTTGEEKFLTEREIEQYVSKADSLSGQPLYDHVFETWMPAIYRVASFYKFIDNNNDLYLLYSRIGSPQQYIRVYGDAVEGDPESDIVLKRQWKIPQSLLAGGNTFSLNVTHDGWLSLVTTSGMLVVIDKMFKEHHHILLPGSDADNIGPWFVRNGMANDDKGGIYVVSGSHMQRVQWTGKKLSLSPEDGAWVVTYPNENHRGSGTTPTLMGWGEGSDRLVLIGDASRRLNFVAYWRDEIPADWKGIEGQPRRVAGIVPVSFDDDEEKPVQTESSPIVKGYGAFIGNMEPAKAVIKQDGQGRQLTADLYSYLLPGYAPRGGIKTQWDPKTRTFERAWVSSDYSVTGSVCSISGASNLIYCLGVRDGIYTLEGIDWDSGESAFHYGLGSSHRYTIMGGAVRAAPNGAVDCACAGGLGMVRIQPNK
ncbi:MAG: hypothetical protein HOC23_01915 [Halieaceae bacterium]|jgi:hypothetical protein|nr:hypothetical protein [Halieaceae bacterium]